MTRETDQPNEEGFAGDPSTPQPQPDTTPIEHVDAERIAVPASDLTTPIAESLQGIGHSDDDD